MKKLFLIIVGLTLVYSVYTYSSEKSAKEKAELEEIIQADKAEPDLERDAGWDAESLIEDVVTGQFKVYKPDND